MNHPDQSPKLPTWIFLVTDAALLGAAWYIAEYSPKPMAGNTAFSIVGCILAGAVVALVPLVARYERRKNEMLDQRQRELEALGRTISTSAEQISIAANGFNEITELAHKNLKQAEQLPHRLQEKVAEFNAQLDNAREDDREELEKELAELRASETERLQIIADKVHKAVAELSRLDTIAQKHVTSRAELVERAGEAITKAQTETVRLLADATAASSRQLAQAQAKALTEIDAKLAACTASAVATITAATESSRIALPAVHTQPLTTRASIAESTSVGEHASPSISSSSTPLDVAAQTKRSRKPRREDTDTGIPPEVSLPPPESTVAATPASSDAGDVHPPIEKPVDQDHENVRGESDVLMREPKTGEVAATNPAAVQLEEQTRSVTPTPAGVSASPGISGVDGGDHGERPARKRSPKKTQPESVGDLTLELSTEEFSSPADDEGANSGADVSERVISSDGATRLIATAYIGIGNRLFIRGSGPGLSWEKGVPLQFVSIGKWRWETADASSPVTVKLYKNDELECAALGAITLDPGHQQEVTARF